MKKTNRASVELSLFWKSKYGSHEEKIFLDKVDFWRDIFPGNMREKTMVLEEGEFFVENFEEGKIVEPYNDKNIFALKEKSLKKAFININGGNLFLGRFYRQGDAWTIFNCFKGNREPFRLIDVKDGIMIVDTNHPLAKYPISIKAKFVQKLFDKEERGGECNHIAEISTKNGPGFQVPHLNTNTDFYNSYPFQRVKEGKDSIFYSKPRFINHLDDSAIKNVKSLYSKYLKKNIKILDLMSSWESHLPDFYEIGKITGLGMNEDEMKSNKNLSNFVVHDLNLETHLPFRENEFDAVICTSSIEYLIKPLEVAREVARIIKPEGKFITIFSDRWFPGKEISLWADMHQFERVGFVLDIYLKCGMFKNLKTESIRGFPRPVSDKYIKKIATSDPIFLVCGCVRG